jgi:hypothetical protein
MRPWFIKEGDIIPFPKKDDKVIKLPNVGAYPDFLTGVEDLQSRVKKGELSDEMYKRLYTELLHRFMRREDAPWFIKEVEAKTNPEYQSLIQLLQKQGLKTGKPKLSRTYKIRHIRVGAPTEKITDILKKLGATVNIKPAPNNLSSTYDQIYVVFPINYNDKNLAGREYNIASALKKGRSVGIKVFTPTNLGLAGKTFTRQNLYQQLKNIIPSIVSDEDMLEFFMQSLDVAVGKRKSIDAEIMSTINDNDLRQLGIDFGEVLGPLMTGEDQITYAAGNSMLADVEINGKPISIKSASGSGTSFKAIVPYLDKLRSNKAVNLNKEEQQVEAFFRAFVDTPGTNNDKIVAGSHKAQTPEHQAMARLVGNKNFNVKDLETFAGQFGKKEYGKFLKTIYPVSVAGGYKIADKDRPNGLPQDAMYYMGRSDKTPPAKQAGKPSWMARGPAEAGRNIMIYILAASFLKDAKQVEKKEKFSKFLSKTMEKTNAELMWVSINRDGTLFLQRKPITDVQIDFQYHAPSHIPGNNLPGFSLKL